MILSSTMFHAGGGSVPAATGIRFQSFAMGNVHSAMINSSGQLYTAGNQSNGRCGNGVTTNAKVETKQLVTLPTNAIQVACGPECTSVLLDDFTVRFFGKGTNRTRGDGTTNDASTPVSPSNNTNAAQVSIGYSSHFILKQSGELFSSGNDIESGHGALQATMTAISAFSGVVVVQVSAGWGHAAAIDFAGNLWTWGGNFYGQLGRNGTTNDGTPTKVSGMTGCLKVSCGRNNTHVVMDDGTVWSAGKGTLGENGDGQSAVNRSTFVQVTGVTGATDVSCGENHGMAIHSSGISAWGRGTNGEVADGTSTTTNATPVSTTGPSGTVANVHCGFGSSSMASNTSGGIFGAGSNGSGLFAKGDSSSTINFNTAAYTGETVLTP